MVRDNIIQIKDATTDTIMAIGATVTGKKGSTTATVTDIEASTPGHPQFCTHGRDGVLKNGFPQPPAVFKSIGRCDFIGISAPIYQVGAARGQFNKNAGEERYRRSTTGQSVRVFILATARTVSLAQAPSNAVPVTANNFNRGATDMYFASNIKQAGA
jgi:hypothetical protein